MIYHSSPPSSFASTATITYGERGSYHTASHGEHRNLPLYQPRGIQSLPCLGDEVLQLTIDGRPRVIGTRVSLAGLEPGELRLSSSGGAVIHLKNDGTIQLNGLTITKQGEIVSP